jgi:tetratricopeptide (TPR) repeat protein
MTGLSLPTRRRVAAIILCGAMTAAFVAYRWRRLENAGPPIPEFETAQASPKVAEALARARGRLQKETSSGASWGRLGMIAMAHHYHSQARACFAEAERLVPGQVRWPYYGAILDEETSLPAALEEYRKAAAIAPGYAPLRLRLARALMRLDHLDEAENEFRRAAELDRASPFPEIGLGRLELARGAIAAAQSHFESAASLAPWSRSARLELARCLQRLGEVSSAYRKEQEARRLPAVAEDMPDPLLREVEEEELTGRRLAEHADEAIGGGDLGEGVRLLTEFIRQRPDLSRPQLNLGQILQAQGKILAAVEVLQQAVDRFPDEALAHFSLGTALEMSGENDRAVSEYRAALRLKPDYADAHFCLGLVLRKQKEVDAAVDALRHAVSSNPGFAPAHLALASALAERGDRDGAIRQTRLAVHLAPNDSEAKAQLERLSRE